MPSFCLALIFSTRTIPEQKQKYGTVISIKKTTKISKNQYVLILSEWSNDAYYVMYITKKLHLLLRKPACSRQYWLTKSTTVLAGSSDKFSLLKRPVSFSWQGSTGSGATGVSIAAVCEDLIVWEPSAAVWIKFTLCGERLIGLRTGKAAHGSTLVARTQAHPISLVRFEYLRL